MAAAIAALVFGGAWLAAANVVSDRARDLPVASIAGPDAVASTAAPALRLRLDMDLRPRGDGSASVQPLLAQLLADPWVALLAAIEALGRLGSADAMVRLADMAAEGNPALRDVCRAALGSPASRLALIEGLKDADPRVALAAARSLAQFPGADAATALAEAVRSGDPSIRQTALQVLIASGAAEGLALAQGALVGSDLPLARAAAESLLAAGSVEGRQLLMQATRSADPAQRAAAAQALAQAANRDADWIGTMVALAADSAPEVRRPTLSALSQQGDAAAAEPVLNAASLGTAADRAHALELLGNMSDRRAGELIAAAIADPSPAVAAAAILAAEFRLGQEVDSAVAARLVDVGQPAEVRQAAARTLRTHGGPLSRTYQNSIQELLAGIDEPA